MNIKFNIEKSQRKALAQKIGELAEMDVRYCGVPSCAYEIGFFTLSKDAVLSFADRMDNEVIERVLDGLEKAGYTAAPAKPGDKKAAPACAGNHKDCDGSHHKHGDNCASKDSKGKK